MIKFKYNVLVVIILEHKKKSWLYGFFPFMMQYFMFYFFWLYSFFPWLVFVSGEVKVITSKGPGGSMS